MNRSQNQQQGNPTEFETDGTYGFDTRDQPTRQSGRRHRTRQAVPAANFFEWTTCAPVQYSCVKGSFNGTAPRIGHENRPSYDSFSPFEPLSPPGNSTARVSPLRAQIVCVCVCVYWRGQAREAGQLWGALSTGEATCLVDPIPFTKSATLPCVMFNHVEMCHRNIPHTTMPPLYVCCWFCRIST